MHNLVISRHLRKLNLSGRLLQDTHKNRVISICDKGDGYTLELLSLCEEYEIDIAMLYHRCHHLMHAGFASLFT